MPDRDDGASCCTDGPVGAETRPDVVVIVPPRSSAVPGKTAETAPTQRHGHFEVTAERCARARTIAAGALNRMLDLGRPESVRIA